MNTCTCGQEARFVTDHADNGQPVTFCTTCGNPPVWKWFYDPDGTVATEEKASADKVVAEASEHIAAAAQKCAAYNCDLAEQPGIVGDDLIRAAHNVAEFDHAIQLDLISMSDRGTRQKYRAHLLRLREIVRRKVIALNATANRLEVAKADRDGGGGKVNSGPKPLDTDLEDRYI